MEKNIVSKEDVEHIAKLSRLEFSEDEMKKIQADLNMIVDYCSILNEVQGDAEVESKIGEPRADEVQVGLTKNEVVKNAPVHNDNSFIVPKVVE
mgnify:FL=1